MEQQSRYTMTEGTTEQAVADRLAELPRGGLLCVVGARPNFMKMAPILRALAAGGADLPVALVHTGQHYGADMQETFFRQLGMPVPDIDLEVGSGSHAAQTAEIMLRFEPVIDATRPRAVVVVGDVNSTLACALVAVKNDTPVVHVEAGLRSRDRGMPEEINRVLTDQVAALHFTTERKARDHLLAEGIAGDGIHFVGNVMIDTLRHHQAHPIALLLPVGYLEALGLMSGARIVLTDSGGMQEESTALGIPCLTLRNNTERPVTIDEGTNILTGNDRDRILGALDHTLATGGKAGRIPELWDGHAGERIAAVLLERYADRSTAAPGAEVS